MIISIEAEKAFDKIQHPFMIKTLDKVDIEGTYISTIRAIYDKPEGFPGGSMVKNPPANAGQRRCQFSPWVHKIPWRRKWPPTPKFLPGKLHEQKSLVSYSSQGCKESDMTE